MIKRTLYLAEANNVVGWFEKFKENRIKGLKIKDQWIVLSNIKEMVNNVAKFQEFRDGLVQDLQTEYFGNDEKSIETQIPKTDENGETVFDENGSVVTEPGRKIKDEYFNEYNNRVSELNNELQKLLIEKTTYEFKPIDLDAVVESLDDDTPILLDDIDMLSFCDVNSADDEGE